MPRLNQPHQAYDNSAAGARVTPAPPAPALETALGNLSERLDRDRERLALQLDRIERVIARAFGPEPVQSEQGNGPAPVGAIAMINVTAEQFDELISRLSVAADRLDTLV